MFQLYRISIEFYNEKSEFEGTLAERWIKTRSLNAAKAWATNFSHKFDEMRFYWGTLERGWSSIQQNGTEIAFVSKSYWCRTTAVIKCEWRLSQIKVEIGVETLDVRSNNDFVLGYLCNQIEASISL